MAIKHYLAMPPKEEPTVGTSQVPVIRSGMFGQLEQFVLGEDWEEYQNRLEMFFLVNETSDEMKVPVMFTVSGPSLYTLANRLCAPESPRKKTYTALVDLFKAHLAPTTNVVSERYVFRKCEQLASQSIAEFIVNLKAKAQSCEYGNFLLDALRDQFVVGVCDESLRKKLLTESGLTFDKACSIARSYEAALQQNKEMSCQSEVRFASVHKVSGQQSTGGRRGQGQHKSVSNSRRFESCFRCGRHHNPATCPARDWKCYTCGRKGHISTYCVSEGESDESGAETDDHRNENRRVAQMSEDVEVLRLNMCTEVCESKKKQ